MIDDITNVSADQEINPPYGQNDDYDVEQTENYKDELGLNTFKSEIINIIDPLRRKIFEEKIQEIEYSDITSKEKRERLKDLEKLFEKHQKLNEEIQKNISFTDNHNGYSFYNERRETVYGYEIPKEAKELLTKWQKIITEALIGEMSVQEAKKKIIKHAKEERGKRIKNIKDFEELFPFKEKLKEHVKNNKNPELKEYLSKIINLLSDKRFNNGSLKDREELLARIIDQIIYIKEIKKPAELMELLNWGEQKRNEFDQDLAESEKKARNMPPEEAWEFCDNKVSELRKTKKKKTKCSKNLEAGITIFKLYRRINKNEVDKEIAKRKRKSNRLTGKEGDLQICEECLNYFQNLPQGLKKAKVQRIESLLREKINLFSDIVNDDAYAHLEVKSVNEAKKVLWAESVGNAFVRGLFLEIMAIALAPNENKVAIESVQDEEKRTDWERIDGGFFNSKQENTEISLENINGDNGHTRLLEGGEEVTQKEAMASFTEKTKKEQNNLPGGENDSQRYFLEGLIGEKSILTDLCQKNRNDFYRFFNRDRYDYADDYKYAQAA